MKKTMKTLMASILTTTMLLTISAPVFAATIQMDNQIITKAEMTASQLVVIESFETKNIDVVMNKNGDVTLVNPTAENIAKANQALLMTATSYPTEWVHMPWNDVYTSKRINAATKSAFATALTAWLSGVKAATTLINIAVAAFGVDYFVDDDTEDMYYSTIYHYRELGPGSFDSIGNFIGDYQIKRTERITNNSSYTGGDVETSYKNTTTLNVV